MAFSKSYAFNLDIYLISLICKALSHSARILIIKAIAKNKVASFKQIKKYTFNQYRSGDNTSLSRHIKYLKRMNLIKYVSNEEQEGYVLNTKLGDIIKYLLEIIKQIDEYNIDPADVYSLETMEGGFKNNLIGEPIQTDITKL